MTLADTSGVVHVDMSNSESLTTLCEVLFDEIYYPVAWLRHTKNKTPTCLWCAACE